MLLVCSGKTLAGTYAPRFKLNRLVSNRAGSLSALATLPVFCRQREPRANTKQVLVGGAGVSQNMRAKRIGGVAFEPIVPSSRYAWHFIRSNMIEHKLPTFLVGGLWLSRLNMFKDPWEGKLPERNLGLLNKLMRSEDAEAVVAEYEKAAATGYASCWHPQR